MADIPYFYRLNAARFLSVVTSIKSDKELGFFMRQFSVDLVTGVANSDFAKELILEATDYIEKKKIAGKKGGKQKSSNAKALLKHCPSTPLANSNSIKTLYAEHVTMKSDEYEKLINEHGEEKTAWMIQKLNNAKGAKGYKYKSDYRAILSWVVDEAKKNYKPQYTRDPMAGY